MTTSPPEYFVHIEEGAKKRWYQLESDPGLAGPWHQLFRQIQSPRHVLSELLQNADDAGATWAKARIEDQIFHFSHNGEDFDIQTLESLCQFGFSNKRHLHTIGFRGVGFKSVFSLGPRVEIDTPSLSFDFEHKRFTLPIWISRPKPTDKTVFTVAVDKKSKIDVLEGEFTRWTKSPLPLLFFQNLEKLEIQTHTIRKDVTGKGPVNGSEYIVLTHSGGKKVLSISSEPEDFPHEALVEIRDERGSPDFHLPPCNVQIILTSGTEATLYTVLPTEVKPLVPFSINAPFVQDPSRKEIKHPANSFTNTWLLQRAGRLAAKTIMQWLKNTTLDLTSRAEAYKLMPNPIESNGSLASKCSELIIEGFKEVVSQSSPILLGHDGSLSKKEQIVAFPDEILKTWEPNGALEIFYPSSQKVLAREVNTKARRVLVKWDFIETLDRRDIAEKLIESKKKPSRPEPLERLVNLWSYLYPIRKEWQFRHNLRQLPIVPVAERGELFSAESTLVLGGKETKISHEDWSFLMGLTDIVDPKWVKLMADYPSDENEFSGGSNTDEEWFDAAELFNKLKLNQKVGLQQVIASVADKVFSRNTSEGDRIKLARIAAHGQVEIPGKFRFLCRDGSWKPVDQGLVIEEVGDLESVFPVNWIEANVISKKYEDGLSYGETQTWRTWTNDKTKSKLMSFPTPKRKEYWRYGKPVVLEFCSERGGSAPSDYRLKTPNFRFEDFDWEKELWSHWKKMAKNNKLLWITITSHILKNWSEDWENRLNATIFQEGNVYSYSLDHEPLRAEWLHQLRALPCVPDTFGHPAIPASLCILNPDTRPFQNIERFVHPDLDKLHNERVLRLLARV